MINYLVKDGNNDQYTTIFTYRELNPHKPGQMPWGDREAGLTLAITYNIQNTSRSYNILQYGYNLLIDKINIDGKTTKIESAGNGISHKFDTPGLHTVYFKVKDIQDPTQGSNAGPIFQGSGDVVDSIYIPSDLKVIPNWFFAGIKIDRLVIPKTVNIIGSYALNKQITGGIRQLIIQDGVIVQSSALSTDIEELYCYGKFDSDTYDYFSFGGTGVMNVSRAVIDCDQIFTSASGATIQEIELGKRIRGIYSGAFYNCNRLTKVKLDCNIPTIPYQCFYRCTNLTDINIPNTVTTLSDECFRECSNLEHIIIPNNVTTIGYRAFNDCISLKSISVPDSVVNFGTFVFCGCKALEDIYIGQGITVLGERTFNVCYLLNNVTMPENLITIGPRAFQDCYSFTNIVVPDKVTSIGENAFLSNTHLKTIVIGKSVSSIGNYAFNGSQQIESIYMLNTTPPTLGYNIFYNVPHRPTIYVPAESLSAYQTAYSSYGLTILPIPENE